MLSLVWRCVFLLNSGIFRTFFRRHQKLGKLL